MEEKTRYFDISRKIIASTTTDSWRNAPHCGIYYEGDATELIEALRSFNSSHPEKEKITVNSAMLKLITEAVKASPDMNGHVSYCHGMVKGRVTLIEHVDISVPILFEDGKMMTVTLRHMEGRSMRGIRDLMNEYRKRLEHTDMEAVMYMTGLSDTAEILLHGRVFKAAGRLIGAGIGQGRVAVSLRRMRRSIIDGRAGVSLTPDDIRPGSITVSNIGAVCRSWKGSCTMLQVVPPQICAIAVGALQKKPAAEDDRIVIKEIIPITVAFDHRAVDFSAIAPFMERMDEMLSSGELIRSFI